MYYKNVGLVIFACLILSCKVLFAQTLMPSKDTKGNSLLLNGTWKFKYIPSSDAGTDSTFYTPAFDASKWATIKVPGHWELQGFAEPQYGRDIKEGIGLYRTAFSVPPDWKGNPVYIAFDGVQFGYSLWINGRYAGEFASSYNRQTFDITNLVHRGKTNTLAVRVTTRAMGWEFDTNDDWSLSGIVRDVTLFSLPPVHIKDIIVESVVANDKARISIQSLLERSAEGKFTKGLNLSAQLLNPSKKLVKELTLAANGNTSADNSSFAQNLTIERPLLWTAETPNLYTLRLTLKDGNKLLQQYSQQIGIREVDWSDGILRLNGKPIKLRGVGHHDLSPINGRAITGAELLQDLQLMRKANINFLRTSHYPPQPRLLELCDSLGIYLMVEVPFGYGDEHLKDKSYLPILETRAKATVWRDKNHPSVIIWSVGNENPVTEISLKTARYVKALDNTRPVCFPQRPSDLEYLVKNYPDSMDVYSPHYPTPQRLREYARRFNHPVIVTEYAHALGLDSDLLDSLHEIVAASPNLAGGAVWTFQDQGILRKANEKVPKDAFTKFAWKDSVTMYDTHGEDGTDGIVYANRIPQIDYWQVRKVYTPVKALNDTLTYQPGRNDFALKLLNRYDFTDLSTVKCGWQLFADTTKLRSGTIPLKGSPHDTVSITITTTLPYKPAAAYYYLKLSLTNRQGYQFYERTYPIALKEGGANLVTQFFTKGTRPVIKGTSISQDNYRFEFSKATGQVQLKNKTGRLIISDGPYLRVGRKPTMAQQYFITRNNQDQLWHPFILSKPETEVTASDAQQFTVNYTYTADSAKGRAAGKVAFRFSDSGCINLNYHFVLEGKEKLPEAGLSFLIPASLTEFRWIGKGPYEAYPGKDKLSEFGIYHLNTGDLYFPGNRQEVECAVFSDNTGNGFALIADKANLSVERTPAGIVVSHNALVSGRFNKFGWPNLLYSLENIKGIEGSFTIVPIDGTWPAELKKFFGKPDSVAVPFAPFYYSYDQ